MNNDDLPAIRLQAFELVPDKRQKPIKQIIKEAKIIIKFLIYDNSNFKSDR
jgi:hypothetical protein